MLLGGFYVRVDHIPNFLRWLRYTSAFLYSYQTSLQIQILLGQEIICQGGIVIYACGYPIQYYGPLDNSLVVQWLGVSEFTIGSEISILICMLIFLRIASYVALRFAPHNIGRV